MPLQGCKRLTSDRLHDSKGVSAEVAAMDVMDCISACHTLLHVLGSPNRRYHSLSSGMWHVGS